MCRTAHWIGTALARDIHLSVRFLDNIIDVNKYPLPEIDALSKRIRRIGFGVMGFADALVKLGIPYNTDEGIEFGRKLQAFVDLESKRESERLADERGPFPEWATFDLGTRRDCGARPGRERIRPMQLLRNCNVNTVAPTGTISIIAGCSSGIEPLFAVAFMRNQAGVMMPDVNEDFLEIAKTRRLVLRRADRENREAGAHPLRRSAGEVAASLRHGARHHPRVARPDAGSFPGALRLGHLEDDELSAHRDARRRTRDL